MKTTEKAISIAVLFSLVLCSCGRDGANLARRNDDNIVVAGAVSQEASAAKQGNKGLEAGGGQVANANDANAWAESLQTTADISKSLNFAGTKETQKQNDHFSNVLSLNSTPKQPRIEEAVTGQAQIGRYGNEWINKTRKKAFKFPQVDNKALSFHGDVGKEGRQGDWYWQDRVERRGGTKEFFKNNENVDWIFKEGIGLEFMATQAWLDVLNAGVDSKFEGLPIGWLRFWKSDIFLNFADLESGEKFWKKRGLDFSETEVGEKFWKKRGLDFSGTKTGEKFWISEGLKFSRTKIGEEFWKKYGLDFSKTKAGEEFWKKHGLDFSGTKVGEKFWTYNGLRFSKTKAGKKFLKEHGPKFLETKAGEEFKKRKETKEGASSTKKKIIIGGLSISLIAGSAVIGWRRLGPRGRGVPPPPGEAGGPRGPGVCRCGGLLGERAELEAERREEGGAVEEEEGIDDAYQENPLEYDEILLRISNRPNFWDDYVRLRV